MKTGIKFALLAGILTVCVSALGSDLAVLQNGFSIRHDHRQVLGSITRLYTGADNTSYVDVPTAQIAHFEADITPQPAPEIKPVIVPNVTPSKPVINTRSLSEVINGASDHNNLDPDLISSVIHAESGFNTRAVSPKGAQGLMQLMPKTAANLGVANSFDPGANVEGGTKYLRELLEAYNFDLIKALAAYNAGPMRVKQYHGVPPYYETQAYVARIVREFNQKKLAERKAATLAAKNKKASAQKTPPQTQIIVESPPRETPR